MLDFNYWRTCVWCRELRFCRTGGVGYECWDCVQKLYT